MREVTNEVCGITAFPMYIMVPFSALYAPSYVAVEFQTLCMDLVIEKFTGNNFYR